jgi:chromosome segregation ATPase
VRPFPRIRKEEHYEAVGRLEEKIRHLQGLVEQLLLSVGSKAKELRAAKDEVRRLRAEMEELSV